LSQTKDKKKKIQELRRGRKKKDSAGFDIERIRRLLKEAKENPIV